MKKVVPLFPVPDDLSTLPAPPVPAGLDLRHFDCMHLDTYDLLESPIWDESSDAGIATALRLWARSWQQVPCASLPNNDATVRKWAGCEGKAKRWKSVQKDALRGFELCNDGRIYHHKVAEMANRAAAKSRAGKRGASVLWNEVKPLKNRKTRDATAYGNGHGTSDDIIYSSGDGRPDGRTDAEKGRDIPSPIPPDSSTAGPGASVDPRPGRPTARELGLNPRALGVNPRALGTNPRVLENVEAARPDHRPSRTETHGAEDAQGRVCVHYPAPAEPGKRPERMLWINQFGGVDEISFKRDLPDLALTHDAALELRQRAMTAGAATSQPATMATVE